MHTEAKKLKTLIIPTHACLLVIVGGWLGHPVWSWWAMTVSESELVARVSVFASLQ
jgi:hypothetical protein